jgi:hypothetical protein
MTTATVARRFQTEVGECVLEAHRRRYHGDA